MSFEETSCIWEADSKGIEATLHQIASGLQSAAEGYLTLASHISKIAPYKLPQVIAQIPLPPMDIPIPIRKALTVDGESKVVDYLLHGEYEITKTSWSKLQKKHNLSKNKIYSENILIFFQTLWQKRESPPVGFEPDASHLPDECPTSRPQRIPVLPITYPSDLL